VNINFDIEAQRYKFIVELKKQCLEFVAGGVLFNQKVLIACGSIDTALQSLSISEREKFINGNQVFFTGFAWTYYQDWRESRAKSCAHLMDMYKLLNIKLTLNDFVGETFYAGIPKVTNDEVNSAIDKYDTDKSANGFSAERIGIDGRLHPCDQFGDFLEMTDFNDIYSDGAGVTKQELDGQLKTVGED